VPWLTRLTWSTDWASSRPGHSVATGQPVKADDTSFPLKRSAGGHPQTPPPKRHLKILNNLQDTDANTVFDDDEDAPANHSFTPRPLWVLGDRDKLQFLGEEWWTDATMFYVLQFLQTLFDPQAVRFLDPASVDEPEQLRLAGDQVQFPQAGIRKLPVSPTAQLLFPMCVAGEHWVAVRIRPSRNVIDIFDPKLNHHYYAEACEKVQSFCQIGLQQLDEPRYTHSAPIQQANNNDCGPIAMIIITYCAFNEVIDTDVDLQCCRRLFYHLVCDKSRRTNKKEPAEETSSYITLETIDRGTRLSLETNTIRGHIDSVASHLEQIRGFVREAVAPRLWTREGLALVSKMQKAASNQVELPSEILLA
jgi:hypothetical protein